jgi:hypothetical protein
MKLSTTVLKRLFIERFAQLADSLRLSHSFYFFGLAGEVTAAPIFLSVTLTVFTGSR